jgi:hypothetical protein
MAGPAHGDDRRRASVWVRAAGFRPERKRVFVLDVAAGATCVWWQGREGSPRRTLRVALAFVALSAACVAVPLFRLDQAYAELALPRIDPPQKALVLGLALRGALHLAELASVACASSGVCLFAGWRRARGAAAGHGDSRG